MNADHITLPELFMLIAYLSFPVWAVARAVQWQMLKQFYSTGKLAGILVVSLIISFIFTLVIWGEYAGNPTISFICIPAVAAEGVVLLMTFIIKKSLLKKWRASS